MKALTRLTLAALALSLCAAKAAAGAPAAQSDAAPRPDAPGEPSEWVAVSPAGEEFTARMPKEPLRLEQEVRAGTFAAKGRRYTATAGGGARYFVWSLTDSRKEAEPAGNESYGGWSLQGELRRLDRVAEAAWEMLVTPELERFYTERLRTGAEKTFVPRMPLRREFELGGRLAREYEVQLEKEGGPVYVLADGARLYVVAALAADRRSAASRRFVDSFGLKTATPAASAAAELPASGLGPGGGAGVVAPISAGPLPPVNAGGAGTPGDYEGPFKYAEVTKRAVITYKPAPAYTEDGRKFDVVGVVRLRAVLSKTGEVTNLSVVKYLPHGLTEKAIDAAKQIRFTPAQKDGRLVSQYVVLEYNFNIY
jgi:TonB family protein